MENLKTNNEVIDLSLEETTNIYGGETGYYPLAYLGGSLWRFIKGAALNPPDLPSASVYK